MYLMWHHDDYFIKLQYFNVFSNILICTLNLIKVVWVGLLSPYGFFSHTFPWPLMERQRQCTSERRDHKKADRLHLPGELLWTKRSLLYDSISNGRLDVARDIITNYHFDPHDYYWGLSHLYIAARGNHVDIVECLIKEGGCDPMMGIIRNGCNSVLHYVASEGLLGVLECMVMNINGHIMDKQYRDINGRTVLHCAKYINVVKYLINECNCDIMTPDKDGNTILHVAASEGSLNVMKYLINTHHYPMTTNNSGQTVLHCAVDHLNVVEYVINECNCDIMVTDKDGVPFLHYVASKGLLDVLKCMVMNINGHIMDEQYRDTNGQTVLHRAVRHIDVVKYLINECNCDIMTPDKDGNTILHYVASKRLPDVLKYLINTHHYPMTTNNSGQTGAVKHIDVVKYLFNECNCDIMTPDKYGIPVLHYVASEGLLDVLKCMVMNINGHIMDKQYRDTNGRTVLHCAVKHIDVVKYLINKYNCDIMATDKDGIPVLHYVASEGLLDVLKCMVMNINGHIMDEQYRDTNGRTILHCAVKHIDVVKYLINECNCDIMVTAKNEDTILHVAASKGSLDS